MKRRLLFFFLLLPILGALFPEVTFSGEDAAGDVVVEVEYSATVKNQDIAHARSDAVRGALQKAVEQTTASLMTPEIMAAKAKILTNNIFLKADQYIQNYRLISEQAAPGVYSLVLRVTVSLEGIKDDLRGIGLGKELEHGLPSVPVAVMLRGLKTYAEYVRFREFLKASVRGVEEVLPRGMVWETVSWQVDIVGGATVLAGELSRVKQFPIKVSLLDDHTIEVIFVR